MGNSAATGSQLIVYTTRDNIPIQYIYYDLKGKNRFPPEPSQRQIQYMFEKCLKDIVATPQNLEKIRDFNSKYKFRFVILHGRKLEEYKEKHELSRLRRTHNFDENLFKGIGEKRKKELEEKLQLLENNETAIKMHLGAIDRFISEKNAWTELIQIKGIERLVKILNKAIQTNKQGTRTIFQNQIEILKMLKSLSDHNPKEYFQVVSKLSEYTIILMRAYHPVNVAVTAYVLLMLQDYNWKVENGLSMLETLRAYQAENQLKSFLDPFVQAIYQTNNILMCFYNLRFINQMLISIVDDNDKRDFDNQLHLQRYELLIVDITQKLQDNFFKIESSTFQAVSQQIYKYATRAKKDKENLQELLMNRTTTQNLDLLHQHILVNFVEEFITSNESDMKDLDNDDDDDYMTVHVPDNDKKCFHKFIVDTFSEIQHYYKYSVIIDQFQEGVEDGQIPEEFQKMKNFGLSCEGYVKRIKGSCMKNGCEDIMLNCFKAMQYFEKSEWKRLETFVLEDIKIQRSGVDVENYKKQLEEKEREIKAIKKEFYQMKTDMVNMSKIQQPRSNPNVSKLDMTLFELEKPEVEKGVYHEPKKLEIPNGLLAPISINSLSNILPPPLSDPPADSHQILPPSPALNNHILPPPPGLNTNILPPPPTLGNNLTQPPTMNTDILPPPQGLNNQILPPPPSLNTNILPPPPSLDSNILPPPPSLNIGGLPPPPTLHIGGLPPPPSLNFGGLPPPPSIPDLGIPNIGGLPSIPSLGGLPSIGGLPPFGGALFPEIVEKQKEKRKPKVTMKNCNYKTLTYSEIQKTIWSEIDDTKVALDQTELETFFSRAVAKELLKVQSAIQISTQPKKKEAVKLLGSDRWRNMEIVLTKLKLPEGAISQALTTCSGKYAVPNVLEPIRGLIPTEQEEMLLSNYDGDVEDLGKPEKFLKELISVPEYANRIKSILFSGMREQLYFDLQKKVEDLTTAFVSLKSNYRLHYILQVALAIGNYLNGTGLKGGAWGFKLDTLERLEEVKSQDNKMNAGLYIIKETWKKYKYPIFDKEEVDMYQFISKMPISQIKIDLADVKKYAVSIEKAFNSKKKDNPNDRIDEHCEEMLLQIKSKYIELQASVKKLQEAYNDCATYYCEDPSKAASDEIGKKLFKSVLFIFNTEKIFYELEERRKKQEARKAVKNQVKFNDTNDFRKEPTRILSEESKPTTNISPVKLPMPPVITPLKSGIVEVTTQERMKELQKTQQERQKKFLEEMMKKRTSKMVAFRQSRAPNGGAILRRNDPEIDFLNGL